MLLYIYTYNKTTDKLHKHHRNKLFCRKTTHLDFILHTDSKTANVTKMEALKFSSEYTGKLGKLYVNKTTT